MRKQENGESDFVSNIGDGPIGGGTTHKNCEKSQTYRKAQSALHHAQATRWWSAPVELKRGFRVSCCVVGWTGPLWRQRHPLCIYSTGTEAKVIFDQKQIMDLTFILSKR